MPRKLDTATLAPHRAAVRSSSARRVELGELADLADRVFTLELERDVAQRVDAELTARHEARWQRLERGRNVALWVLTCCNLGLAIGFAVSHLAR